jgi:threonylcarbamoyladenosine tRNA methylthiotransferase MtaB
MAPFFIKTRIFLKEKSYKIATLGCRTNQYESEAWRSQLAALGYVEAKEGEEAEICIVNTCTVTESADQRSRVQIRQMAKENEGTRLFVTGCLAERVPEELAKIVGVEKVISNLEKEHLLKDVFGHGEEFPEFVIDGFKAHTRAFVKVQDGCNSYCSYCTIPFVRGRSRSRNIESIVKEIETLVVNGYKEVVLTGINIGDFDGGGSETLAHLVRIVDQIEGLERIRISSIDPDEIDDALLDAVIFGKKTCHSMHMVLQAGSNAILKRMNRKYTKQEYLFSVYRLKNASKDFAFTTDVIVGFPGETDADFMETVELIREVEFAKVHMFPFSVRPKTRAARFTDKVPKEVIHQRKEIVLREAEKVAYVLREKFIGRQMKVLLEEEKEGMFFGHTENFLGVFVKGENLSSNQIVSVDLLENSPLGLIGKRND